MFRKAKLPNSSKAHNRSMHQVDVRHSLYATLIGVRNEIWGQTSTWTSPPQYLEHKGHCGSGISSNSPLAEPINWHQMFSGRQWSGPFLDEALPLGQIILSSERSGAEEAEIETAFAGEYLACLKSKLPLHNVSLVNEIGADNVRVAWVKITILPSVVGLNYWNGPADPFFYSPPDTDAVELHYWNMAASPFYPPYDIDWSQSFQISWEWRCYSSSFGADQPAELGTGNHTEPEMDNHAPWQEFGPYGPPARTREGRCHPGQCFGPYAIYQDDENVQANAEVALHVPAAGGFQRATYPQGEDVGWRGERDRHDPTRPKGGRPLSSRAAV